MIRRVLPLLALLFGGSLFATPALHHFATSLAEADYNVEAKRLEVALSMNPADLEWVLSRRAGKRISLEHTEGVEELVSEYLRGVFFARLGSGELAKQHWVGLELDPKFAWAYFELELPNGLERVRLTNRIMLRWERDQVNTVNLRVAKEKRTLSFDRRQPSLPLGEEVKPDKD